MAIKFTVNRPLFNLRFLNEDEKRRQREENRRLSDLNQIAEKEIAFKNELAAIGDSPIADWQKSIAISSVQKKYDPVGYQEGVNQRIQQVGGLIEKSHNIKPGELDEIAQDITEFIQYATPRSLQSIYKHINRERMQYGSQGRGGGTGAQIEKSAADKIDQVHSGVLNDSSTPDWVKEQLKPGESTPNARAYAINWAKKHNISGYESAYLQLTTGKERGRSGGEITREEATATSTAINKLNAQYGTISQRQDILAWVSTPDGVTQQLERIEDAMKEHVSNSDTDLSYWFFGTRLSEDQIKNVFNDTKKFKELGDSNPELANLIAQYMNLKLGNLGKYADLVMIYTQGARLNEQTGTLRSLQNTMDKKPNPNQRIKIEDPYNLR